MPSFRMIYVPRLLPAVSNRTAAEPPAHGGNRPSAMQATQLLESTAERALQERIAILSGCQNTVYA
eukprot:scaffold640731_cov22-Prasinocladus_malaysianus.AAC.1